MAFIPDDAAHRLRKLTPVARLVYLAHCEAREHAYRASRATYQEIADAYGLSLGGVKNATTELKREGWLAVEGEWTYPLIGDFSPVDKNHPLRELPQKRAAYRRADRHETMTENHQTVTQNHQTMILNPETMTENHQTVILHNKDHARDLQPLPASSSTHTSTASHAHLATGDEPKFSEEPPAAGVCVSEQKFSNGWETKFEFADILAYTESERARGQPIRDTRALAITLARSGEADALVERFLRPPPSQASATPARAPCSWCRGEGVMRHETRDGEKREMPCPGGCQPKEVVAA